MIIMMIGWAFFILSLVCFWNNKILLSVAAMFFSMLYLIVFGLGINIPVDEIILQPISVIAQNDEVIVTFKNENGSVRSIADGRAVIYNNQSNIVVKAYTQMKSYGIYKPNSTRYAIKLNPQFYK